MGTRTRVVAGRRAVGTHHLAVGSRRHKTEGTLAVVEEAGMRAGYVLHSWVVSMVVVVHRMGQTCLYCLVN